MKTSCIRHPKFQHCLTVHSWQFKATGKNLYAALLLSYLEEKVNILLELKNHGLNYNKGWIKLNMFQIQHGIFAESMHYVEESLKLLEGLQFIQIAKPSPEFPTSENEIWVKVNALQINNWIEVDQKSDEVKMSLLDFNPFLILMVLSGTEEIVEVVEEKVIKAASPLKKFENDLPLIQRAKNLFHFWKWVCDKPRSQPQDKYLRMIIDRIQDGYSDEDIALSFYGIFYRKNTDFAKYDAIKYFVGETAKLDRMTAYALEMGFDEDIAKKEFSEFLAKFSIGQYIPARQIPEPKEVKSENGIVLK